MIDTVIILPSGVGSKRPGLDGAAVHDAFALCVLEAAGRRAGVPALDALALQVLAQFDGTVARNRLARELALAGSACSRLLNRLEETEFAVRLCGDDRRTLEVELLDDGWDALERVQNAFSNCREDVMPKWGCLLAATTGEGDSAYRDFAADGVVPCDAKGGRPTCEGGVDLGDALAANQALACLQGDGRLARSQALCLMTIRASGMNASLPSASAAISRATSLPRTTVRSALRALQARGLL